MSSILREKVKGIIRDYLGQQPSQKFYSSGTVSSLNDDGSVSAVDSNGNQVTAFPKFPMVVGQNVVLVNDGAGNYSAVPIGTKVNPTDIIHPPYFTGGTPVRFQTSLVGPTTINTNVPAPAFPQFVYLQDAGKSAVLQFIVGGLGGQTYLGMSTLSPNGRFLGTMGFDTTAGFVTAFFGSPIIFNKQIDWASWGLPKNFNDFTIPGNLLDPTIPLYSFTPISNPQSGILNLSVTGNPVTNADVFQDMAVDNSGNLYILLANNSVTLGNGTVLTFSIYRNGVLLNSISVTANSYRSGTLWKAAPEIVLARNINTGLVDILTGTTTATAVPQDVDFATTHITDSLLSYWAPFSSGGNPVFLSIDNSSSLISWAFTNYHTLTGGNTSGYILGSIMFNGISSGFVTLTSDPGIIPNNKFAGRLYPIQNVKNVDPTHFTMQLGNPVPGISPGKTNPGVPNFAFLAGSSTSFIGARGSVVILDTSLP